MIRLVLASDGFSGFLKVYRVYRWSSWISEGKGGPGLSLAVVRDLREARAPAGPEELAAFETDVLAGFVLARAAAGLSDDTIRSDVLHLEQLRAWFGRPLWDMEPADADAYFGKVLRDAAKGTRLARSQALKTYFLFLEIRHKVEIHQMTGRVAECPVDEMNRPRGAGRAALRIPPSAVQVGVLFAGWRAELATCRKFAPAARSYAAARLMAEVGLRVNEASQLDLADVKWDLGRFGKLHVRHRQGRPRVRAAGADGAADQRRRGDPALVRPGRVGPASTTTTRSRPSCSRYNIRPDALRALCLVAAESRVLPDLFSAGFRIAVAGGWRCLNNVAFDATEVSVAQAADLPGAAHLELADGVVHLDPKPALLEAMLAGWVRQQRPAS